MLERMKTRCPLCGVDYNASDLAERAWHEDTDETDDGMPVCAAATIGKFKATPDEFKS